MITSFGGRCLDRAAWWGAGRWPFRWGRDGAAVPSRAEWCCAEEGTRTGWWPCCAFWDSPAGGGRGACPGRRSARSGCGGSAHARLSRPSPANISTERISRSSPSSSSSPSRSSWNWSDACFDPCCTSVPIAAAFYYRTISVLALLCSPNCTDSESLRIDVLSEQRLSPLLSPFSSDSSPILLHPLFFLITRTLIIYIINFNYYFHYYI